MSKQPYERPLLIRHQSGLMNKFSRVQAMRPMTHIDGVARRTSRPAAAP